jgi:hypothetical protein
MLLEDDPQLPKLAVRSQVERLHLEAPLDVVAAVAIRSDVHAGSPVGPERQALGVVVDAGREDLATRGSESQLTPRAARMAGHPDVDVDVRSLDRDVGGLLGEHELRAAADPFAPLAVHRYRRRRRRSRRGGGKGKPGGQYRHRRTRSPEHEAKCTVRRER